MKQRFRRTRVHKEITWIVLFCILLGVMIPAGVYAKESKRESITAGFFQWDGYHVEDEDGIKSGYGYDFLKMTENYCNWSIRFTGYDKTWSDMLKMLDNGQIDVLTSAQKTAEWEKKYDYSRQPIGTSATILSVRKEESSYVIGDPTTYNGMTIGCLAGSSRNKKFASFAKKNNFSYTFINFNTFMELKKALAEKKVDAILSTNLRTVDGETVLEEFDPVDYYVIVKKGNDKIMDQMNHAIAKMNLNMPSWKNELQNKYFTDPKEEELVFDKEELEYLKQLRQDGKVFTVVTNPDLAPYSSFDEEGKPVGIVPDLFRELAKRIGIFYQFQNFDTYEEYNEFVCEGHADIDLTCFHDYGQAEDNGVILCNPYIKTSLAMVSKDTFDGKVHSVAKVNQSERNTTYSAKLFHNVKITTYATNEECANAVLHGQADATYEYTYMAQKEVEEDISNQLMYTILPQYEIEMCIGVQSDIDYRLLSVLNEGIRCLEGNYTQQLIQKHIIRISENDSILSLIYDYPSYTFFGVFLFIIILIFVVYAMLKKKQTEKLLQTETEINTARTEFFLMISHEIRTPLNAVVSYLSMLQEEYSLDKGAQSYLKKAQSAAMQLTEISNNMQDYSNISSGTIELNKNIIPLKEVILQINQVISLKAGEKKQNYHFAISNLSRQYLSGDRLRITMIYQNILENAVKFTPEGGTIEATLEEECIDLENVNLIFTCKDTGKGMSKEFTKQINTAFHQSDSSYSRTHGGLGLGLFLTQFFIKLMGGSFQVESQEGMGSTFSIFLPMKSPRIEELQENGIKCRAVRAIVYETEEYDRQMAKKTLKSIGIKAEIVNDLEKMEKKIRARSGSPYSYALCIVSVDGLHDYEKVIHALAAENPTLEILAITGDESFIETLELQPQISHVILKERSYFEFFNTIITDFGESPEKENSSDKYNFSGIRALIAEDNAINADILSKMLKQVKISSVICENGKIAVETFEKAPEYTFQIILMDIQMPEMDGLEATRRIRNSKKKQGAVIPIFAVSANAFPEDVKNSLTAGMNEHLAKPVDKKRLFKEIEKYCSETFAHRKESR